MNFVFNLVIYSYSILNEFVNQFYFEGHRPEVTLLYAVDGWKAILKIN